MSSLDHPSMLAQPVVALDVLARNPVVDATPPEMFAAPRVVVALVGMQLVGPTARSATRTDNRRQSINQLLEDTVPVGPGGAEHQRNALPVRDEVALAAELAAVRRVGACVRPPPGAGHCRPIHTDTAQVQLAGTTKLRSDGLTCGNSGWSFFHNAELTN